MKILRMGIIIILALTVAGLAYAESTSNVTPGNKGTGTASGTERGTSVKIDRGLNNLLFGWTDIPKSIIQVTRDLKNPLWGITAGTFKGIGKAFPRTISGAADIISFPIADYNKTPVKPDELNTQVK